MKKILMAVLLFAVVASLGITSCSEKSKNNVGLPGPGGESNNPPQRSAEEQLTYELLNNPTLSANDYMLVAEIIRIDAGVQQTVIVSDGINTDYYYPNMYYPITSNDFAVPSLNLKISRSDYSKTYSIDIKFYIARRDLNNKVYVDIPADMWSYMLANKFAYDDNNDAGGENPIWKGGVDTLEVIGNNTLRYSFTLANNDGSFTNIGGANIVNYKGLKMYICIQTLYIR